MADFSCYGGVSDEWLAVEAAAPRLPADMPILERRQLDHAIATRDGQTIEGRTYRPASVPADEILPLYIHFHGGGYFFGTLASEDAICARIALGARVIVLNVNYRHTPEYTYPTAWDDGQDAYAWVHAHVAELGVDPAKVVVGGISAGAHITSSLTLQQSLGKALTSCPRPRGRFS
ncbi:unnamed protein product [Parascedosporium putredinis]|uniref:Alpha/beta hydrolase fold-3 domain-containing protein n=1 Tax=Parascedosporium putredinis TaxID=1442378 RepID=A0A9P1GZE0_9PEZI|nr:unnamed protein product [Parascedosporium putredinis]CAI7990753.1 unnamed protein product [Parascedosporium putredinis]